MINNIFKRRKILIVGVILSLFLLMYFTFRDNTNYSKDNPKTSSELFDSGIYKEIYQAYGGGVFGGDVRTVYITDSLTFRKYVGKMFDNESIVMEHISQDKIAVLKLDKDLEPPHDVIDSTTFSISNLKNEGKWE